MSQYRALRDFGSHLGNHRRGDLLALPDGPLPRGFAGLVERVPESQTQDAPPAADPAPPGDIATAGDPPPSPDRAAGYEDKMVRPAANTGHGHVRPRPDGAKARCGGPGLCAECSKEAAGRKPKGRPA